MADMHWTDEQIEIYVTSGGETTLGRHVHMTGCAMCQAKIAAARQLYGNVPMENRIEPPDDVKQHDDPLNDEDIEIEDFDK